MKQASIKRNSVSATLGYAISNLFSVKLVVLSVPFIYCVKIVDFQFAIVWI